MPLGPELQQSGFTPTRGEDAAADRVHELGVVALHLVGVRAGEPAEHLIQLVAAADVARDHGRAAGPGVALGEQ